MIVPVEQRFKTMREFRFVELLNQFPREVFSILGVYKNILDSEELKWELKLDYVADFEKQASSIQEVIR